MKKKMLSILMAAAMLGGTMAMPVMASETDYALEDATFDNVELKLYANLSEASLAYYEEKIQEFNDSGKGITVELTNITTEADYIDRLSTDFASGDIPNVFMEYGGARCLDYMEAGALLNLEPYLDADPDWYNSIQ